MSASQSLMCARTLCAATTFYLISGAAVAASEPPAADPVAANARTAPVPLNSGVPSNEFQADPSKITMEVLPNGTRLYHMNGQGMQAVTARIGADGKVQIKCIDQAEQTAPAAETVNAHEQ